MPYGKAPSVPRLARWGNVGWGFPRTDYPVRVPSGVALQRWCTTASITTHQVLDSTVVNLQTRQWSWPEPEHPHASSAGPHTAHEDPGCQPGCPPFGVQLTSSRGERAGPFRVELPHKSPGKLVPLRALGPKGSRLPRRGSSVAVATLWCRLQVLHVP